MTEIKILHDARWLQLRKLEDPRPDVDGYVYSHEVRCQGIIVAVLPVRLATDGNQFSIEYLLRNEKTPCWNAEGPTRSSVTGGYEGGSIAANAARELLEETGYRVEPADLMSLGTCYASKSSDTVYYLYTVDLTGVEAGEPIGDGSVCEAEATNHWVGLRDIAQCMDPLVSVMHVREAYRRLAGTGLISLPEWKAVS